MLVANVLVEETLELPGLELASIAGDEIVFDVVEVSLVIELDVVVEESVLVLVLVIDVELGIGVVLVLELEAVVVAIVVLGVDIMVVMDCVLEMEGTGMQSAATPYS